MKIEYSGDKSKSDIRNQYYEKLRSEADKLELPVNRPAHFGAGTYMTIGVVDEDFIFGKKPLDIPKIVKRLKEIEKLILTDNVLNDFNTLLDTCIYMEDELSKNNNTL